MGGCAVEYSNVGKSCPITNGTWRKVGCYTRFFIPLSHPAFKGSFGSQTGKNEMTRYRIINLGLNHFGINNTSYPVFGCFRLDRIY